ncbi:hypothetical protein, partial [Stenotrophomonas maltophilia]|uniref:hypothetical protein n=1 Tax=Stenotrophomonas maltophilia TaxID=40324 RepID=UPI0013DC3072
IGAALDGSGMVGVAPGVNLVALSGFGNINQALGLAAAMPDVRVINGSFGPILAPGTTIWETGDQESRWQVVRS